MQINLNEKIAEHYQRLEDFAKEAEDDTEETFSSRASALNSVTRILNDLKKIQEEVYNMDRLMIIEKIVIETVEMYLTPAQRESFLEDLEDSIGNMRP